MRLEFINPVLAWLVLGAIFFVGELFVSTFFLLSLGIAALATAVGVYLAFLPNTLSQCGAFVVAGVLLVIIFRKRVRV